MELPFVVNILLCSDTTYYPVYKTTIGNRLKSLSNKEVQYTKSRLPVKLINLIQFENKQRAYDFERYLKTGSGVTSSNKRLV